ncbi:hypothetical protein VTO42DRAFT_2031 [Malbranchea cinnamomea]
MSATNPADVPKRATAAQLANRKIKAVRERRTRINSPGVSAPTASPFTLDTNAATSSSATGGMNGFNFGQSNSSPQTSTPSGSATPNGSQSFTFGGGGSGGSNSTNNAPSIFGNSTSSFNFSPFSSNQEVNNPFASINQSASSQGFKGSIFNIPPPGSQDNSQKSDQQAVTNGSIFGASTPQQPPQTPFTFGSGTAPSTTLFSTPASQPSTNVFGQSTAPASGNIFGQSTAPSSGDVSGQSTAPPSSNIFGQSTAAPSGNLFGQSTTQSSGNIFAQSTAPTSSNIFGQSTAAPSGNTIDQSTGSTLFNQPTGPTSLFGASKPSEPPSQPATDAMQTSPDGKPMFNFTTSTQTSAPAFSISTQAPAFNFGVTTPFGAPSSSVAPAQTPATASPAFNFTSSAPSGTSLFGATSKPDEPPKSDFSAPKSTDLDKEKEKDSSKVEFKPLFGGFGAAKPVNEEPANKEKEKGSDKGEPKSLFGGFTAPKPVESVSSDKEKEKEPSKAEPKPLFGGFTAPKPIDSLSSVKEKEKESSNAEPKPLFANFGVQKNASSEKENEPNKAEPKPLFGGFGAPKLEAVPKPTYVHTSTQTKFEAKSKWASFLPPSFPDNLTTEEERENHIRMWRLGTLNASFKAEIAKIDPQKQDIDNIIAYYVMMRTQLGIPTELTSLLSPVKSDSPDDFPPKEVAPLKRKADARDDSVTQKRRRSVGEAETTASGVSKSSQLFSTTSPSASMKRKASDAEDADAGENASAQVQSQSIKPPVSDTLAKFASSFIAQKSQAARAASPSGVEESDKESDEEESVHQDKKTNGTTSPANGASPTAGAGRSLFDRVQVDKQGKPVRQIEPEKEATDTGSTTPKNDANPIASLFSGSKFASSFNASGSAASQFSFTGSGTSTPRTPSPASSKAESAKPAASTSIFGNLAPTSAPTTFGSTSPSASPPATSLFATPSMKPDATSAASSSAPSPSIFANLAPKAPVTFGSTPSTSNSTSAPANTTTSLPNTGIQQPKLLFPAQQASSSLSQPSSAASSTDASRSTTPVQSDTGADDETENLPQADLSRGAGEEDEDVLFETRSKAHKLKPGSGWELQGVGFLRLLKNRTTERVRVLLRADPSGKVILNSLLVPQIEYSQRGSSVQFLVFQEAKPESWTVRLKTEQLAKELSTLMQENKKNGKST